MFSACIFAEGRVFNKMGVAWKKWAWIEWGGRGTPGSFEWRPGIDQRMLHLLENMDRISSDQSLGRKHFTIKLESVTVSKSQNLPEIG